MTLQVTLAAGQGDAWRGGCQVHEGPVFRVFGLSVPYSKGVIGVYIRILKVLQGLYGNGLIWVMQESPLKVFQGI